MPSENSATPWEQCVGLRGCCRVALDGQLTGSVWPVNTLGLGHSFFLKLFQLRPLGALAGRFRVPLTCHLPCVPFATSLLSGTARCSRLILYCPAPTLESAIFLQGVWFIYQRAALDVGAGCPCCPRGGTARLSELVYLKCLCAYSPKCTDIPLHYVL